MAPGRKSPGGRRDKGAIEVVEEAVHLLRMSPPGVLASYYVGSLPFALGLLYFWADMSKGAFAHRHCAGAALGVALLFVWMKCWHAVYAALLSARIAGAPPPRWDRARVARLVAAQAIGQPSSLVALPLAALVALPLAWTYAFYHNLSLTGDGSLPGPREAIRRARELSLAWPAQNHLLMAIFSLLAGVVYVNLALALVLLPSACKAFLGFENIFTLSGWHMLNTTFFAAVSALTYLCVNPLSKACYVLRCFYAESRASGADLRAELARFLPGRAAALALLAFLALLAGPSPAARAGETPPAAPAAVRDLDGAIERVLAKPEYAWRSPREKVARDDAGPGLVGAFLEEAIRTVKGWLRPAREAWVKAWRKFEEWYRRHWPEGAPRERGPGRDWQLPILGMGFTLLAVVLSVLAVALLRAWLRRRVPREVKVAVALPAMPDLTREDVAADLLPSEEWQALARDWLAKGEYRLALRAFYLASLAFLAQRGVITLARSKSNREYEREARRRARDRAGMLEAFSENIGLFERAWYGMHDLDEAAVARFRANHDRILGSLDAPPGPSPVPP